MLTKEMKIAQVTFDNMAAWQPNLLTGIGSFVIACSQWEYIYELVWKDLNPSQTNSFIELMRQADRETSMKKRDEFIDMLSIHSAVECKEIARIMREELEKPYRALRDKTVHGFYHIYEGCKLISHFPRNGTDIIGEDLDVHDFLKYANDMNEWVNKINSIRRKYFHGGVLPSSDAVSVSVATHIPLTSG